MPDKKQLARFEQVVLPHLDAAYNLARWLMGNDHDAEDAVQEACLRAYKFIDGFRGDDGRAWLLAIVRNTCYTCLRHSRFDDQAALLDETVHPVDESLNPEMIALRRADRQTIRQTVESLPPEFREVIVLRELEGMSYKEIAHIAGVPLGTVMSRLARARQHLQHQLNDRREQDSHEL